MIKRNLFFIYLGLWILSSVCILVTAYEYYVLIQLVLCVWGLLALSIREIKINKFKCPLKSKHN